MIRTVMQELRFALRSLRRSRWFTLTAVLMLSVGLGLAMYMFGAIQSFVGLLAGIGLTLGLGRFIAAQLYGVQATDPLTPVAVVAALGLTALHYE